MSRTKSFFFFFFLVFIACTENEKNARIIIEMKNIEDDYLLLSIAPIGDVTKFIFDTLPIINGKATFDTCIHEPHKGYIIANSMFKYLVNGDPFLIRSKVIEFFIDEYQTIKITGEIKGYQNEYNVVGSLLNLQFTDFNKTKSYNHAKLSEVMFDYENCFLEEIYNDDHISLLEQKISDLTTQIFQNEINYVLSNTDSELAAYLLSIQSIDTLVKYFEMLSPTTLETNYGKLLKKKVEGLNVLRVGDAAPAFTHKTLYGEEFILIDYLGSPIVLYFWGTWCAPCVGEIPKLKEFYSEYNEKLKFVGIACRDNLDNLTSFINQHDIRWTQLLNSENSGNDLSKIYGVKGYPTKILLNKEGFVSEIFLGATEEFYVRIEELINE